MALKIWVRMPWTIEAMAMTVVTPMTTPRMVSADRGLLARSASKAMPTPSPTFRMPRRGSTVRLFGAEGGDGVEARRARGREYAEDDAGAAAQRERHRHRPERDPRRKRREARDGKGQSPARQHALQPTQSRQDDRLDEELAADVGAAGPERLAQP